MFNPESNKACEKNILQAYKNWFNKNLRNLKIWLYEKSSKKNKPNKNQPKEAFAVVVARGRLTRHRVVWAGSRGREKLFHSPADTCPVRPL